MGPGQPWQNNEPEPLPPMDNHSNNSMAMQVSLFRKRIHKSATWCPGDSNITKPASQNTGSATVFFLNSRYLYGS